MFLTLLSNSSYSRIHHVVLFHAEWAGDEMGNEDRDWALVKDEPPGGKGNGSGVPTVGKKKRIPGADSIRRAGTPRRKRN